MESFLGDDWPVGHGGEAEEPFPVDEEQPEMPDAAPSQTSSRKSKPPRPKRPKSPPVPKVNRREYISRLEQRLDEVERKLKEQTLQSSSFPSSSNQSSSTSLKWDPRMQSSDNLPLAPEAIAHPVDHIEPILPSAAFASSKDLRVSSYPSQATVSQTPELGMGSLLFSTPSEPRLDLLDLFYDNLYIPIPAIPKCILMENLSRIPRILLLSYYAYGAIWVQDLPENSNNQIILEHDNSTSFSFDSGGSSKRAPLHQLGMPYLEQARKEISRAIDNPTPLVAHSLFLLGLYCIASGNSSSASLLLGLGIKTALQLGLYEDTDTPIPELSHLPPRHQLEIKRRIWWMIQLTDAFVSSSNGDPRWIQESDMRVALPSDESIWTRPLGPPSDAELEEEALQIYIMSSSEDYHGGIAITDALAAHTVLLRIHSRIAVYLRDLTNKRLTTLQADQRFVALEASSRAVFGSLSPWLSPEYGRVYDNVSLTHRQPLPWISAHVGMFCHLNILLLYKSRVTLLAPGPRGQAFISALGKLQESAQFVTYVASLFLRDNPEFRNVGPYVCVPLYEAGLAWLKISRLSLTEAYRPQMDHNLVILIRALGFLSRRYVLAESLRDGLADMRMSRFSLAAATRRKR